jgi:hypothetical protein
MPLPASDQRQTMLLYHTVVRNCDCHTFDDVAFGLMRVVVTRPRSSAHPRHHSTHAADARSALRTLQTRAARYARCRRAQRATHASDVIICHPERRRGTVADLRFAAILRQAQDDSGGDSQP